MISLRDVQFTTSGYKLCKRTCSQPLPPFVLLHRLLMSKIYSQRIFVLHCNNDINNSLIYTNILVRASCARLGGAGLERLEDVAAGVVRGWGASMQKGSHPLPWGGVRQRLHWDWRSTGWQWVSVWERVWDVWVP